MKTAVAKQQKKGALTQQKNVKTAVVKAKAKVNAAKGKGLPMGKGLKISFKPSELSKTTERNVASQVLHPSGFEFVEASMCPHLTVI